MNNWWMKILKSRYPVKCIKIKYLCSFPDSNLKIIDNQNIKTSDEYCKVKKKLLNVQIHDIATITKYNEMVIKGEIKPDYFQDLPLRCHSCGSFFHNDPQYLRGYLPDNIFEKINKGIVTLHEIKCNSCYNLSIHSISTSTYMSDTLFQSYMNFVKARKALVIYLLDITDMNGSVINNIFEIIGIYKPVIFVFNKLDLIPQDGYHVLALRHIEKCAIQFIKGHDQLNLLRNVGVHLISCRTGYGIKQFIFNLTDQYEALHDIVIMGTSNAGKSTLFNIIQSFSAYASNAQSFPSCSSVSPFPGTTSNLIRFPITYNCIHNLRGIYTSEPDLEQVLKGKEPNEYSIDTKIFEDLNSPKLEDQRQSFRELCEKNINEIPLYHLANQLFKPSTTISNQAWLYDIPSVLSSNQFWKDLTPNESKYILMTTDIHPKIFKIPALYTIYAGNFIRLDVLSIDVMNRTGKESKTFDPQKDINIIVALFTEYQLRSFVAPTNIAPSRAHLLTKQNRMKIPEPRETRSFPFPELKPVDITIIGDNIKRCVTDICISSVGWFGIAAHGNIMVKLRVWTPDGKGVSSRTPSLVPQIIMHKGPPGVIEFDRISQKSYKFMHNIRAITYQYQKDKDVCTTKNLQKTVELMRRTQNKEIKLVQKELEKFYYPVNPEVYKKLSNKKQPIDIKK